MASAAEYGSAVPSPFPSRPQLLHVEGRNCMGPIAPAEDGPMFAPCPDSTAPTPARTFHVIWWQALPPTTYQCRYECGIPATGRAGAGAATVMAVSPSTITGRSTTASGKTTAPKARRDILRGRGATTALAATGGLLRCPAPPEGPGDEAPDRSRCSSRPECFCLGRVRDPRRMAESPPGRRTREHRSRERPAVPEQDEHEDRLEPLRSEESDLRRRVEDRSGDDQDHGENQAVGHDEGE